MDDWTSDFSREVILIMNAWRMHHPRNNFLEETSSKKRFLGEDIIQKRHLREEVIQKRLSGK